MSEDSAADDSSVPYIAHHEFRNGAAHGRFRIVVNPALARPYVVRRTRIDRKRSANDTLASSIAAC